LLIGIQQLAQNARRANVSVTLKVWDKLFHAFQVFLFAFPEAQASVREFAEWAKAHMA
jgi:acetyl esterase/lipase